VEIILITVERDFVRLVVLDDLQNCANPRGETELVRLMVLNRFTDIKKRRWHRNLRISFYYF
jgi:hypothetical protein